jgi:hypothetical protein
MESMDNAISEKNQLPEESNAQSSDEMRLSRASFESKTSVQAQKNGFDSPERPQVSGLPQFLPLEKTILSKTYNVQIQNENQMPQESPKSTPPSSIPEPSMSLPHELAFIALISCAQLLTQSGFTMSLPPGYIIGEYFGVKGSALLSWYAAAYSLTVGTLPFPLADSQTPSTDLAQEHSSYPLADSATSTATRDSSSSAGYLSVSSASSPVSASTSAPALEARYSSSSCAHCKESIPRF